MVTNFLELDEMLGQIFVHRKLAEAEKERRINKTIENADRLIYFQSETVRGRKKFFSQIAAEFLSICICTAMVHV